MIALAIVIDSLLLFRAKKINFTRKIPFFLLERIKEVIWTLLGS